MVKYICILIFIFKVYADCKEIDYDSLEKIELPSYIRPDIKLGDIFCSEKDCYMVDKIDHDVRDINGKPIDKSSVVNRWCIYPCVNVTHIFDKPYCNGESQPFGGECHAVLNDCTTGELPKHDITWVARCYHREQHSTCEIIPGLIKEDVCFHTYILGYNLKKELMKCGDEVYIPGFKIYFHSLTTNITDFMETEFEDHLIRGGFYFKNNSGEFLIQDWEKRIPFRCAHYGVINPEKVVEKDKNCTYTEGADKYTVAVEKLHTFNDVKFPRSEYRFMFPYIPNCRVIKRIRPDNCTCMQACPTTLEVSNYPCFYGNEIIKCDIIERNMAESIITYNEEGIPKRTCFAVEKYLDYTDYSSHRESGEKTCSGVVCWFKNVGETVGDIIDDVKEKLKENKKKVIVIVIVVIIVGVIGFILFACISLIIGLVVLKFVFKLI